MVLTTEELRKRISLRKQGCWVYKGPKDAYGYGRVFIAGKERKAQRVYYEAFIGALPKGARLRHHLPPEECVGAACCNPAHVQVQQTLSSVAASSVAQRVCKQGHVISGTNALIEQRGDNLLVRCRICRQAKWREEKQRPA